MNKKKEFPVLYKYSTKGTPQQWQIIVDGGSFYSIDGQVGGKLTTSAPTVCKPKNVGRSNETTAEQQALLEAEAKFLKKKEQGSYNEVLTEEKNFFEPMLAFEVEKYEKLLFTVPTWIQPKLDGLRAVNENNSLKSRNGKEYLTCPHLYQDKVILDGELYNHEFYDDFNEIVSIIKQPKPTEEDFAKAKELGQFWCYDFPTHPGVFSDRYANLKKFLKELRNKDIVVVPTYPVHSWDEIVQYHKQFMKDGYEGSIIRLDLGNYENKRSKQLLKYKDWMDAEFEIIDFEEGEGGRAGTIGAFWVVLDPTKPYVISNNSKKRVNCCKSNVKGKFEYVKKIWENRDYYIGKQATIEFQGYTPGKKGLRFPYVIKLDRQSYE